MKIAKTVKIGRLTVHFDEVVACLNTSGDEPANCVDYNTSAIVITEDNEVFSIANLRLAFSIYDKGTTLSSPFMSCSIARVFKKEYDSYNVVCLDWDAEEGWGNQVKRLSKMAPGYEEDFKNILTYFRENVIGDDQVVYFHHPEYWFRCISKEIQDTLKINDNTVKYTQSWWYEKPVPVTEANWDINLSKEAIVC